MATDQKSHLRQKVERRHLRSLDKLGRGVTREEEGRDGDVFLESVVAAVHAVPVAEDFVLGKFSHRGPDESADVFRNFAVVVRSVGLEHEVAPLLRAHVELDAAESGESNVCLFKRFLLLYDTNIAEVLNFKNRITSGKKKV